MNSYRSESDNRSRREEENAAASENAKWTQRNDNFAISASSSNRELAQSAQSDSPYTPNQSSTPTSSSQPSAGPVKLSPQEAKRVAQTHFRALQLWLKDHSSNAGSTRSGARAKLEKLTRSQSAELSTDVFDEMVRRQGEAAGNSSAEPYLPVRSEFHPKRNQARQKLATLPLQRFSDLAGDVFFDLGRRYPDFMDEEAASPTSVPGLSSRSAPSHLPVNAASALRRTPTPTGAANSASNDVVVPNKSTIVMEEPASSGYGRSARGEISPPTSSSNSNQNDRSGGYSGSPQNSTNDNKGRTSDDMPRGVSRVSETSSIGTRFMANYSGSTSDGGRASWENDELQKIKSDYEYKITVMSKRITDLERENEDSRDALQARSNDANRARELESQVRTHRERYEAQSSTLQKLATDFEALQSSHSRSLSSNDSNSRLRQDLENISLERNELEELSNELRAEVSNLVDELRGVNARYEELLEASEREGGERREIEEQTMIWRKKYEAAKTELRNIKATSQLFVGSTIKIEGDHLPASSDGVIADVHVSAFQTSIDDLLSAGRSKEPSSVLSAMHKVISAVNLIDQDVQSVDPRRISSLPPAEQKRLASLKSKTNATLSNLMTASRNHAVSFGVSPVSLLDAAASHLSAAVIDLVRILRIRRTTGSTTNGREDRAPPVPTASSTRSRPEQSGGRPSNERYISPTESDRQAEENRYRRQPSPVQTPSHENRGYGATRQEVDPRDRYADPSPLAPTPVQKDSRSREQGYGGHLRGGSVLTYGSPDLSQSADYGELKSYLENQTEAIVHSIQALLSAIRSGAQGAQLNENLTQIITIVSSIVAISKDALPRESRQEGEEILLDLTDNCRKLSEMQEQASEAGGGVFNKQTKQSLASSSFGVAKSLKSLNALLK